ncbi:CotS family spore coat protein [Clostridium sp. 19966]|uniref:CotS family spore coat protein n=1 Tax=Clostridium sp. 19966 TaxID=2768166 RepID=UPI0028DFC35B|nr:CotS family spore coat protein [Clostridium sp. 19966]MDT8715634.1 CotS family spore coat protein [Clostridium sp. 19966]
MVDSIRYSDKKFLSRYDLYIDLFNRFDLKVNDVVPLRNVFLIFSDKGKKILKKVEYSRDKLEFIYDAVEYIRKSFDRVMSFTRTKEGEIFTVWNGELYCVLDLVEARECEFTNPIDVAIAAKGMAEMHRASEGFKTHISERYMVGKTIDNFKRKYEELIFFKNLANLHEYKNDFDKLYLSNLGYYLNEVEKSIELLKEAPYFKISSEEDKIAICHHDLAHHNILIKDNLAYFIDFDYAVVDIKVHDLCNFITKAIKNFAFDMDKTKDIINAYRSANSLDIRELAILKALLAFPEDFYSISKDYYSRRKEWDEDTFLDRFEKKLEYKEDREDFLKGFQECIINEK